jgi:diacylglycerol kinase (ATP)
MKNLPFSKRLGFAIQGIRVAFRNESSFRTQSAFALGGLCLLIVTNPEPIWWAVVILTIAAVLAAELINTALELIVDRLHPEQHPMIGKAKDCAAGAVLILSVGSLAVAAALIWNFLSALD